MGSTWVNDAHFCFGTSGLLDSLAGKITEKEGVAKSLKALNHEGHEGHKGKEKLFFVLFVVPFFSGLFATPSKEVETENSGY